MGTLSLMIWLFGLLAALGVGLAASKASVGRDTAIVLAVLAALLSALVEIRIQMHRAEERHEEALGLRHGIEEVYEEESLRLYLDGVVDSHREISDRQNDVLRRFFDNLVQIVTSDLIEVGFGGAAIERSDLFDFGLAAVQSAEIDIDASSYVRFSDWWSTSEGREYIAANAAAAARGVQIRRIFIFDNQEDCVGGRRYLEEQIADGIEVRLVGKEGLIPNLRLDMLIVDRRLAARMDLGSSRGATGGRYFTDEHSVSRLRHSFNELLQQSQAYGETGCDAIG